MFSFRKTVLFVFTLVLGFVPIYLWIPRLMIPYIDFAVLLFVSIYLWTAVKPRIVKKSPFLKKVFSVLFWLPLVIVIIASIALVFTELNNWPDVLRVYFVGGLLSYLVSLIFPVLFLFIADIIRWIHIFFASKKKVNDRVDRLNGEPITRKKFIVNTGLSLGGIALGTMGFGMLHGNYNFKIWKFQLPILRMPKELSGLRILQISDMHLGTWVSTEPLDEAIQYMNELKPDLVFFTGDLVNAKTSEAFSFYDSLQKIKAKYGIYASLGNHDYGHYYRWESKEEEQKNWDDLLRFYNKLGWKLMRNESDIVIVNACRVLLTGVENWSLNPRFPRIGDLKKATEGYDSADLNLLLSHDPTHWDQKVKQFPIPFDITFSGHTHGFQFGFESTLFRWSPAQYLYKHWAGLYSDSSKEKYLYVNRGIGAIGFPGRVGIRPEITLIEVI